MKIGKAHIVPLARQAVALFEQLHALTADGSEFCFPSFVDSERPMSNATILMALRRQGYAPDQMSAHGSGGRH
jgi:integrase